MQVHCELPTKREFTPTDDSSLSPSAADVWFSSMHWCSESIENECCGMSTQMSVVNNASSL